MYIHACVYVYIHTCECRYSLQVCPSDVSVAYIYVCVCACACACVCVWHIYTHVCTHVNTCVHIYLHTCMCVSIQTPCVFCGVYVCQIHTYMSVFLCVCLWKENSDFLVSHGTNLNRNVGLICISTEESVFYVFANVWWGACSEKTVMSLHIILGDTLHINTFSLFSKFALYVTFGKERQV